MAARARSRKRTRKDLVVEQGRLFLKAIKELGPQPDLADAIQAVYEEEHKKPSFGHEGD